jgi:hypothetical protein
MVNGLSSDTAIRFTNQMELMTTSILYGGLSAFNVDVKARSQSHLSVSIVVIDPDLNPIYASTIKGVGFDEVDAAKISASPIQFSGGVNRAMMDLARNLVNELATSHELSDYVRRGNQAQQVQSS